MSDPYPEVRDDESGIVPPQGGRNPEWPKKIRTLTAAELDRLTIDSSGRFYWDGKLVNYEPPQLKPTERAEESLRDPLDPAALEVFDRAAQELRNGKTSQPIGDAPVTTDESLSDTRPSGITEDAQRSDVADLSTIDLDVHREIAPQAAAKDARAADLIPVVGTVSGSRVSERVRLKLSAWQSLGALLTVISIILAASGLAASGLVAAHDWGCRNGLVQSYCPPIPATRPPPGRPDIPA